MQTMEARHAGRRECVFRDRGNPLGIGFGEKKLFGIAQELSPGIEPGTGRNAAISAVNQLLLALRHYATGALLK